ncbi:Exodeoxyribonuclease I subunit C [Lampropedia hyalina DSM 16112]|jgi:exodeoxyribonuclease-1|uniref:Exodeoxyribonuclease I n=1 Tax=Lampropedia hyalina DSM 16112 TaxID=1122156 RepID=A0A1M5A505_9BURK|nr:exodeoxyribonuclease I [Lampropedia hyalina]SHF25046.1 Exodeoxyribonuclease I subunit C [Lampropedia hyalina DSM 16112]
MQHTFLWHDYETFGADPRRDRPAQFAAIRTDAQLNEVAAPIELFCQPPLDYLPDPQSCLITGITPQEAMRRGVTEAQFARRIHAAMSVPGTIGVGYNSIRFDDEFTRHLFWRNLIDPYAREWRDGNARWDLLDVVRMAYALRPQGIQWPQGEDGKTSFRLERLTQANGLRHEVAHDAVSDVRATIALARLLRQQQPRLFDFGLQLRDKKVVAQTLGLPVDRQQARPFVHISGMFGVERGCLALMIPLAMHPTNRNEMLAWDLAFDPSELAELTPEQVRQRLFSRQAELPEGVQRLPLKGIHLNKSPMVVANLKVLTDAVVQRWQLDLPRMAAHADKARALPDLSALWEAVFAPESARSEPTPDPEHNLYGAFVSNDDRRRLEHLAALSGEELATDRTGFDDPRLPELLWRYRARNFPQSLRDEELPRWEARRKAVLIDGANGCRSTEQLLTEIDALSENVDERGEHILGALYDWADAITPEA